TRRGAAALRHHRTRRIRRAHLGLGEGGWPLAAAPPSGDAAGQLLSSYRAGLVPGGPGPRSSSSSSGGGSGHGVISGGVGEEPAAPCGDRKSTRLNSSHVSISY